MYGYVFGQQDTHKQQEILMKFTEKDIAIFTKELKAFKAGIIDKKLDEHIDACIQRLLESKIENKPWWKFW